MLQTVNATKGIFFGIKLDILLQLNTYEKNYLRDVDGQVVAINYDWIGGNSVDKRRNELHGTGDREYYYRCPKNSAILS